MSRETCLLPLEVLAEIVCVLAKVYKIDRERVWKSIDGFLINENIVVPHRKVVEKAVRVYGETKFDFVDCLMVGYAAIERHEILTFDKKLKNYINQQQ